MFDVYRKATTRAVQRVRHLWWDGGNHDGEALCGLRAHEYEPAPSRFLPGDRKPEVVEVSCPVCYAMAFIYETEKRMSRNNNDNKEKSK